MGGGTGLAVLLRGLKERVGGDVGELNAVVTMSDDGGSSGRLRRDLGMPPPGDVRNCLVALADDEALLARLFQHRFAGGEGLSGHSFGNLFLTALTEITGDFSQAVLTAETVLSVRGRILPATLGDVRLRAEGESGICYEGESAIGRAGEPLRSLRLEPDSVTAFPAAAAALRQSDLIVLGPGSLFTSILPNLLIPGIREAIVDSAAPVALLLNLMTQPGETDGLDGLAHLRAIERHAGPGLVDCVLVSTGAPGAERLAPYLEQGSVPVAVDAEAMRASGVEVIEADLLAPGELIRHDPVKLAAALAALAARLAPLTDRRKAAE